MTIGQIKTLGKSKMKENWGPMLLAMLLCLAGIIVATIFVFGIGGIIVSGPLAVGLTYFYYITINKTGDEKPNYFNMLHSIKNNFGESVLASLICAAVISAIGAVALIVFLIAVGASTASYVSNAYYYYSYGYSPAGSVIGVIIAILVLIAAAVISIILTLSFSLTDYILMRNTKIKGWDAVKLSCKAMKGYKGKLFVFNLSFIGWGILTGIFFPLIIYTAPYFFASRTILLGEIYQAKGLDRFEDGSPVTPVAPTLAPVVEPIVDAAPTPAVEPAPVVEPVEPKAPAVEPAPAPAPAPVPPVAPAPAVEPVEAKAPGRKFCPSCGKENVGVAVFCGYCGHKF